MKYKYSQTPLRLRAFGRNIQSMIEYALTIPDRYERTHIAYEIATTLLHLHPNVKENADFQQYIWDSIFIMSDLKLDVDAPFPKPTAEQLLVEKPKRLPYQQGKPRFSQYGRNVEFLIERACDAPTEAIFMDYLYKIVHFMHLCLLDMHKETYIEPIIAEHIYEMSGGRLSIAIADIQAVTRPFPMEVEAPVKRPQNGGGRNRNQRNNNPRNENPRNENPRNDNPPRRENVQRGDNNMQRERGGENNPNFKRRPPANNNNKPFREGGGGGQMRGGNNGGVNNGGGNNGNGGPRHNNNNNNGGMNDNPRRRK